MQVKKTYWYGVSRNTVEHFKMMPGKYGQFAKSRIIGDLDGKMLFLKYKASIRDNWEILRVSIDVELESDRFSIRLEKDQNNEWTRNREADENLKGCIDIDISVTPFTNTLPIKRLNLGLGEERIIKVVYIDIEEKTIRPVRQLYKKLSENTFLFQTVPNDFEAIISVDPDGFVTDYPDLFRDRKLL